MKWTGLASGVAVAFVATACLAETPDYSSGTAALSPVLARSQQFTRENWWTRFGEPINSTALSEVSTSKSADAGGPVPIHGDGYIYAPGSCDCPPPCIYLWNDYVQHPKRCDPYVPFFQRHFGNRDCCGDGSCGLGCGQGCTSCATQAACGCGAPVGCGCAAPMATQAALTPPHPLTEDPVLIKLPRIN